MHRNSKEVLEEDADGETDDSNDGKITNEDGRYRRNMTRSSSTASLLNQRRLKNKTQRINFIF